MDQLTIKMYDQLTDVLSVINELHSGIYEDFNLTFDEIRRIAPQLGFNAEDIVATAKNAAENPNYNLIYNPQLDTNKLYRNVKSNNVLVPMDNWDYAKLDALLDDILTDYDVDDDDDEQMFA